MLLTDSNKWKKLRSKVLLLERGGDTFSAIWLQRREGSLGQRFHSTLLPRITVIGLRDKELFPYGYQRLSEYKSNGRLLSIALLSGGKNPTPRTRKRCNCF